MGWPMLQREAATNVKELLHWGNSAPHRALTGQFYGVGRPQSDLPLSGLLRLHEFNKLDFAPETMRSEAMIAARHESARSIPPLDVLESGWVHVPTIHLH